MNRRDLLAVALTTPAALSVARAQTLSSDDYRQIQAGRDETILEPDLPIIDAHHHLFDRPGLRYMIDDYLTDTRAGHRVIASVYVETSAFARTDGAEVLRPLGEIEFANGIGAMCDSGRYGCRVCSAIVGHARLLSKMVTTVQVGWRPRRLGPSDPSAAVAAPRVRGARMWCDVGTRRPRPGLQCLTGLPRPPNRYAWPAIHKE
jgi:hypothetical protein